MAVVFATAATTVLAGASLAQDAKTINVAIVGNPQMEDIARLTPQLFTAETGINVNYVVLEEQTLREIVTRDVGAGGQQFDVVMIGMFEAPQFGRNAWLVDLNQYAVGDADYDVDDIFPTVRDGLSYDGGLYAAPFYAESSFVMYRKDVLDAPAGSANVSPWAARSCVTRRSTSWTSRSPTWTPSCVSRHARNSRTSRHASASRPST